MRSKVVLYVMFFTVFSLAGWQVYRITRARESNPEVLAINTNMTLEERVSALENRVAALERSSGSYGSISGKVSEQFKDLTDGRLSSPDWTKIPGTEFTFDASLYGNVVDVSWQGWIENGYGSVRLYDKTNHRAVDGSEVFVNSGTRSSFYSKSLSIWRGTNVYHIEGKNPQGSQLVLTSPRLKIVTR